MNDRDAKPVAIDTNFIFGRLGFEIGTQESRHVLDSGETLAEFAARRLAEQKKPGKPA